MREYLSDSATPFRVARAIDSTGVARETADMVLETRPVPGYENYLVRNDGVIFSRHGSGACVNCGNNTTGYAKRRYCSQKCKEKAQYIERVGRPLPFPPTPTPMTPMPGEDGHMRVMLYREGIGYRELVHRLVLTAFVRPPQPGEQACHRTGDPTNNALPNLRWGTQQDNWQDRIRHGNGHSHGEVSYITPPISWPLSNCWAGVTAENQARADERIPLLLQTPAAARFVSVEPMLGPVDLSSWLPPFTDCDHYNGGCTRPENPLAETRDPSSRPGILSCTPSACVFGRRGLDWVICGGETGTNARPMHPDWVRSLRGQCLAARVPFHFKSWGQWAPERDTFDEIMSGETTCPVCGCTDSHACEGGCYWIVDADYRDRCSQCAGVKSHRWPDGSYSYRVGAALSGRLLDGREWDEYPEGTE
ncbi:MAG: DUF5131 family protein [Clostridia bacterium]|nr:DUF5131 family protein [Clostridia bacterium]